MTAKVGSGPKADMRRPRNGATETPKKKPPGVSTGGLDLVVSVR